MPTEDGDTDDTTDTDLTTDSHDEDGAGDRDSDTGGDSSGETRVERRRRQNALTRARSAEAERDDLRNQLAKTQSQLEELSEAKSHVSKLLDRTQAQNSDLESTIEGFKGREKDRETQGRMSRFADQIAKETQVPAVRIRGLLREQKAIDPDFEAAPDVVSKADVRDVSKLLQDLDPSAFEAKTQGGKARQVPGPSARDSISALPSKEQPPTDEGAAYWTQRASQLNRFGQRTQ